MGILFRLKRRRIAKKYADKIAGVIANADGLDEIYCASLIDVLYNEYHKELGDEIYGNNGQRLL